ncbi:transmembrane protein, putative [Bodo saltans]|uniref:Transmembrane protein, putative n=1 Tax=Bodo saltans TaxID=75058 RepID=A0A0S4JAF1_BODSA|nr:transmembrane protein, putative [Bodo saltans]|eukprot:CUG88346.1 transmembrane protein, putative [Bodo saltans]
MEEASNNGMRRLFVFDSPSETATKTSPTGSSAAHRRLGIVADAMIALVDKVLPTAPFPASLLLLHSLLLEPTIGASVACTVSTQREPATVVLGLIVGAAWIAFPCVFVWLVCVTYSPLPLATTTPRIVHAQRLRHVGVGRVLEWWCAEREEWTVVARHRSSLSASSSKGSKHVVGISAAREVSVPMVPYSKDFEVVDIGTSVWTRCLEHSPALWVVRRSLSTMRMHAPLLCGGLQGLARLLW